MRRTDREITDIDEIKSIIENSIIAHIGLFDEEFPYVVPMHYGYEFNNDELVLYMHCAKQGHKLDLIQKNNNACVEIENDISLVSGDDAACMYGSTYSSVIAKGNITIIYDIELKKHALSVFMKHQTNRDFLFTDAMVNAVNVLRFTTSNITAKARKK